MIVEIASGIAWGFLGALAFVAGYLVGILIFG